MWPTWHARINASFGKSTRSTSGEWAARPGLPVIGRVVWRCLEAWPASSLLPLVSLLRNIATIAVFYALPVVQLVITYQTVSGRADSLGPGGMPSWGRVLALATVWDVA